MKKITDLNELTAAAPEDVLPIVDTSANETKKISLLNMLTNFVDAVHLKANSVITSKILDGAVTPSKQTAEYTGARLSSTYSIGSPAHSSFANTPMFITLPSAGIWVITANLRHSSSDQNEWAKLRLYNTTIGADADAVTGDSTWISSLIASAGGHQPNSSKTIVCRTTTANNTIYIQAQIGGSYAIEITSDVNGYSSMAAFRIGQP